MGRPISGSFLIKLLLGGAFTCGGCVDGCGSSGCCGRDFCSSRTILPAMVSIFVLSDIVLEPFEPHVSPRIGHSTFQRIRHVAIIRITLHVQRDMRTLNV